MIVNEVYVGRTKEINAFLKDFTEVRHKWMNKTIKLPNHSDFSKIEEWCKKIWGFYDFEFKIVQENSPNAMTAPVIYINNRDSTKSLKVSRSKGYSFKEGNRLIAITYITSGLFCNENFTDEEVFAVFLHEIGHSFSARSRPVAKIITGITIEAALINAILETILFNPRNALLYFSSIPKQTSEYKNIIVTINKIIRANPVLNTLNFTAEQLLSFFSNIRANIFLDIDRLFGISYLFNKLCKNALDVGGDEYKEKILSWNAYGRASERLSDDFAVMYGFGPQLSSSLIKFNNSKYIDTTNDPIFLKLTSEIPFFKKWYRKQYELRLELSGIFDVHPTGPDRCLRIVESMKHDLKDADIKPSIKKEIESQIKIMEKELNDIKHNRGLIEDFDDEFVKEQIKQNLFNGAVETKREKKFFDNDQVNDDFYRNKKLYKPKKKSVFLIDDPLEGTDIENFGILDNMV